ncbi:hypothetical protein [Mucilaginibacter sp.]|jgi:hypothetical protein|uniref:hypothetical protein n=1 Tax=Mucilaginibacter sp. TaxID=1882438 RepID=UPI003565BD98
MTTIDNKQLNGITIKIALGVLFFTVSVTWTISQGLNSINNSIGAVRTELHTAIDSVKNKQSQRAFQADLHFQQLEAKMDLLVSK